MAVQTTPTNIRFPETLQLPAIIFEAKKWTMKRLTSKSTETYSKDSLGSVSLYLPPIQESHNVVWDDSKQFSTHVADMAAGLIGGISGGIITDWIKLKYNVAVSQDSIATFKDVENRQFSFSFELVPSSSTESVIIKKIIDFFRYHSLPEYNSILINFPSIFEVTVHGVANELGVDYFQFKPMALKSLQVNYGDNNHMQLMVDNMPSKVKIDLSFQEVTKPYKGDFKYYDEEYNKTVTTETNAKKVGEDLINKANEAAKSTSQR